MFQQLLDVIFSLNCSLRSKRFRGVFCTEKPIFLFLDAREMGRERKKGGGIGRREGERKRPSPPLPFPPPPCFLLSPHFARVENYENRVFFSEEPHGNACYAGYLNCYMYM